MFDMPAMQNASDHHCICRPFPEQVPDTVARTLELPTEFVKFDWHTAWSSNNDSEADALWDNINTAHGHIAVDHKFAAEQNPSMDVPGQPGNSVYLLEAYHQLHCLHIMCHADNTPLYGAGDHKAGDGQLHRCKSWAALRDYATANTACFRDGQPGWTLEDRFGHCDDGTDGL
ncbi:cytochrome p450 [Neofusicoccum parvum]|uniref:Cytochrome p450 n=1 Tax=Neofusicoccum parvum TaxID=310453 RepID=A0ACB5S2I4_9PEZI|nr:cytochrome p450 [Neofusicoccum parvum]